MRYLLTPKSLAMLDPLACRPSLCAFDFDGTLAPLVDHPRDAALPHRTRVLLSQLASLYPCVVLSGRSRQDLLHKLRGLNVVAAIGSHGADTSRPLRPATRVRQWMTHLESELAGLAGVWVEDKGRSLTVHYRQARGKRAALQRALHAAGSLDNARVYAGRDAVNVVLADDPHKGAALRTLRRRFRCDWVLYVGDDTNDEDAFAIDGDMISVRIRRSTRSKARYYLRSQQEIDALLRHLIALRTARR